jgi:hypothetical protein
MSRTFSVAALGGAAIAAALIASGPAQATLALTPDGIADGFTLTTFVSGYNFPGLYGPLAQGILPNGNVVTGSRGDNRVYVFTDVDNQTLANAVTFTPYGCQSSDCNFAMTTAGGQVYGAQTFGGVYEHFASNGTFNPGLRPRACSACGVTR